MSEVDSITVRNGRATVEISDEIEFDLSDLISELDANEVLETLDIDDVRNFVIEAGVVGEIVNDMSEWCTRVRSTALLQGGF